MDKGWARTVTVKASWEFAQTSGHDLTQPSIDWDQTQNLGQNPIFLQGPDVFSVRLSYLYYSHLSESNSEIHIKHNTRNTGC